MMGVSITTFIGKTIRMQKIAIHEIGHNLGLQHCADTTCVMQDAVESIKTIDRSTQTYCPACKQKADL